VLLLLTAVAGGVVLLARPPAQASPAATITGPVSDGRCSITNTPDSGKIELVTVIDSATNVGDGGTTGENTVDTGYYDVSETAGSGTNLGDYTSSIECKNAAGVVVASGSGTSLTGVPVGAGDDIVCTITNTRNTGKIELVKDFVGTAGLVNLFIKRGAIVIDSATDVGDGGSTGENTVETDSFDVSETAGSGTSLSDYTSSIECRNAAGAVMASGSGTSLTGVPVGAGDDIVCTITNTLHTPPVPVGGIAELPGVSGSSGRNYVAIAGLAAPALIILILGVSYARRRWLR
jgi:hypothetical protein